MRHPTRGLLATLVIATSALPAYGASPPAALALSFAAYVHGFRAMVITVDLRDQGDAYSIALRDHTVGLVGAMIDNHVASEATGLFGADGVVPLHYTSAGHSRGADRSTVIDDENGVPRVRVLTPPEPNRDKVPASETDGAVDPLSAVAALFHRYATTGRCEAKVRVFDGARLSEIQSWTVGATTVPPSSASPFSGMATECDFRSQELAGFLHDANFVRDHAPQGGHVWLAPVGPGGATVPIRARFSTADHGEIALFLTAAGAGSPDR